MIFFSLWVIVGVAVILPWFPRAFVRFCLREFPGLPFTRVDSSMGAFLTLVAIALWPLALALVVLWWLVAVTIHRPFVRCFESEKEKTDE